MFRGSTLVNLDSKGRLTIPVRYRSRLSEESEDKMVFTIDLHQPCLLLYTLSEWEIIEKKLLQLSTMNPVERRVQRLLLGYASECHMDGGGRLLLDNTLRQHAGITKTVILVGQINKFELWNEQTWYHQVKVDIEAEQKVNKILTNKLQDLSF